MSSPEEYDVNVLELAQLPDAPLQGIRPSTADTDLERGFTKISKPINQQERGIPGYCWL